MHAAAAAAAAALALGGNWGTASAAHAALSLRLHYPMTCGQPGAGPLVVHLPAAFRVSDVRATVRGAARPAALAGSTVTIELPKPPQITCMSIAEGTLPVTIARVRAAAGTYVVRARIRNRTFTVRLRIRD